ncbi:TetR/AcrR family transcriptional regulator [Fructobacillus sp. M2-14]|uniref:TetR/AcrR family transcriptional regulator n=1 Tax=Fructobacillus broussonetiae TaxID=2713173 RepID=A0ABS5R519_9LACO|nr:TetR/AcrR family transcriptional regulator [Fructobacillus broussonetiae]MBS9339237.1 TetR/AcrR family transcriptional regulator [Fructobacillus broussonetiae]
MQKNQTKEKIKNSLLSLIENNHFEKITATEVSQKAHISRSNLYNYYKNKDQIIDGIVEDHVAYFRKIYQNRYNYYDISDFLNELSDLLIHKSSNLKIILNLPSRFSDKFKNEIKSIVKKTYLHNKYKHPTIKSVPTDYEIQFMYLLTFNYILYTINNPQKNLEIIESINKIQKLFIK